MKKRYFLIIKTNYEQKKHTAKSLFAIEINPLQGFVDATDKYKVFCY